MLEDVPGFVPSPPGQNRPSHDGNELIPSRRVKTDTRARTIVELLSPYGSKESESDNVSYETVSFVGSVGATL